jgi:hypothetical protein
MVYQTHKLFPVSGTKNRVIYLSGIGNGGKPPSLPIRKNRTPKMMN